MRRTIYTDRLSIVPIALEHLDDLSEFCCDLENAPYMVYLPYPSKEVLKENLIEFINEWDKPDPGYYEYAVFLNDKVIGKLSVYMSDDRRAAELGWIIDKRYQRRGYAFESVSALMNHTLVKLKPDCLTAECDDRNVASYSLMEKLGFSLQSMDSFRVYRRTGETARERKYIWRK